MDERDIMYQILNRTQKELPLHCEKECCVCRKKGVEDIQVQGDTVRKMMHICILKNKLTCSVQKWNTVIENSIEQLMRLRWQNERSSNLSQQYLYPSISQEIVISFHNTTQHNSVTLSHAIPLDVRVSLESYLCKHTTVTLTTTYMTLNHLRTIETQSFDLARL